MSLRHAAHKHSGTAASKFDYVRGAAIASSRDDAEASGDGLRKHLRILAELANALDATGVTDAVATRTGSSSTTTRRGFTACPRCRRCSTTAYPYVFLDGTTARREQSTTSEARFDNERTHALPSRHAHVTMSGCVRRQVPVLCVVRCGPG